MVVVAAASLPDLRGGSCCGGSSAEPSMEFRNILMVASEQQGQSVVPVRGGCRGERSSATEGRGSCSDEGGEVRGAPPASRKQRPPSLLLSSVLLSVPLPLSPPSVAAAVPCPPLLSPGSVRS